MITPPPTPQPAVAAPAEEPVKLAQVDVDRGTKLYSTDGCAGRPANATRLAKSVAVMRGYEPAPLRIVGISQAAIHSARP